MIKQIYYSDFCDAFEKMGRKDQFTYEGQQALFDYLENLEEGTGGPIELDVIELCCGYTEYNSAWEAMEQYRPDDMPAEGIPGDDLLEIQAKNEKAAFTWLEDHTTVIKVEDTGRVIIENF